MAEMLMQNGTLTELILNQKDKYFDSVTSTKTSSYDTEKSDEIDKVQETIKAFAAMLRVNKTLLKLSLDWYPCTETTMKELLEALSSNTTICQFSCNNFHNDNTWLYPKFIPVQERSSLKKQASNYIDLFKHFSDRNQIIFNHMAALKNFDSQKALVPEAQDRIYESPVFNRSLKRKASDNQSGDNNIMYERDEEEERAEKKLRPS